MEKNDNTSYIDSDVNVNTNDIQFKKFMKCDDDLFQIAYDIRKKVFVDEQNFDINKEIDYIDDKAIHYLLFVKDKSINSYIPVATARSYSSKVIVNVDPDIKNCIYIGRVALLKEFRKNGLGKQLMNLVINDIKENNKSKNNGNVLLLKIGSQEGVVNFYKNFGFVVDGDSYYDEHVLHYDMIMEI